MDSIVFEQSISTEVSSSEFVEKQWLYVVDNNNGSYASQVVLDTTPLSNSGAYINWSEAFILMPLVLQLKKTGGDGNALAVGYAADSIIGLKSGFWQLLHSLTCEFNNGNIIQQVPFLNVFCSFKNLTSWALDDVINWGDATGFHKDSAHSWCYSKNAAAGNTSGLAQTGGVGLSNTRNAPYVSIDLVQSATGALTAFGALAVNTETQATSQSLRMYWNKGLWGRQRAIGATAQVHAAATSQQHNSFYTSATMNRIFKAYSKGDIVGERSIAIDAMIRLKDVADFFCKCPLLKGSTMRIFLSTNQVSMRYTASSGTVAAAGAAAGIIPVTESAYGQMGLSQAPVILGGGGTNPAQIASVDLGQGAYPLVPLPAVGGAAVTSEGQVCLSIVRTQFSGPTSVSAPYTSCRLYAPAYTFNPIAEQRYLSLAPTKKVVYNDIFQYSFNGLAGNDSRFNLLVSNGIPNIRGVLVLSTLGSASNGVAAAGQVLTSSLLSPFSSTGGAPDPIALSDFQIQVSGKNLFLNQQQYDYEQFAEQLVSSNQLNGSLTTSMGSGLISKSDFQSLYRYYYGNVSRSLPSEDGVAKAIQISGSVLPNTTVDLMVFVEFEREIVVDVRTGARVS